MFTEPKIVTSNDLRIRSYVTFYFNGKRVREYNGHSLGINLNPNYCSTIKDRNRLLAELQFELKNALKNNSYKTQNIQSLNLQIPSAQKLLKDILDKKLNSDLSKYYKTDLQSIYNHFIEYLTDEEKSGEITAITLPRIEDFLSRYSSSGTYYMNKRRILGVLFSSAGKTLRLDIKVIKETSCRRTKATLHKIYEKEQMKKVLKFLKNHHENLYLCCLISYGCLLRPHQEVRNLKGSHFKNNFTEIHLSGSENKGKKVRVVYIPDYVKKEFQGRIPKLQPDTNLFSLLPTTFNTAYFNTAWTRAWKKMNEAGIIEKKQTIYSFRHSAAVDVYRRTKDVYLLQKLLGHSNIVVTLKYLRGLGEYNMEELKDAAPRLEF